MSNFQPSNMSLSRRNLMPAVIKLLLLFGCMHLQQVESKQQQQQQQQELSLLAASRSARLMRFLSEPGSNFNHNRRSGPGPAIPQLPRVRPSVDSIRPPGAWRTPLSPPAPQLIRREFNGNWPGAGGGGVNQATRFAHSKDAAVLDVGKNQFYRPKEGQNYNYHSNQYVQNFKASPHFNGNIALKNEQNKYPIYAPIQQHAIPVEASKYIQYNSQGQAYGDNSPAKQISYHHGQVGPVQAANSYAVYEDTENIAKNAANFGLNYQQTGPLAPQKVSKEAEDYLHFMSTNEYFLPNRDPNYKQLDLERDQLKYQQQKLIQKEQPQPQPQQQQPIHIVGERQHIDSSVSSSYNQPLRVSDLFYQQDPAPPNSAVVRGSYQTGQNAFVVKSDGNKSVKHILSTSYTSKTTQRPTAATYPQVWQNPQKTETPEPLRFEFTEHDAIKGSSSYTNAPHGQKFYYETHPSTPHIPTVSTAPLAEKPQPIQEVVSDIKDSSEYANKRPQEQAVLEPAIVSTDPAEPIKDSEAYCEKICANVYDENDEIVCGSDGYMYTGETQLECYSSCLNIEVSIKSKGSCA